MEITTVGLDLAKNVFQVHAIGSTGGVVVRRSLRRAQVIPFFSKLPPCLIGMESHEPSLGARAGWSRSRGAADAAGLRQALCEAGQD